MKRTTILGIVLPFSLIAIVLASCFAPALPATASEATFKATELLGRPTNSSVTVSLIAEQDLEVYFQYGTQSGIYTNQTDVLMFPSGSSIKTLIDGLQNNTRYYYRMVYRENGSTEWIARDEHSFQTQRSPGSTFTFTIMSDSHIGFLGNSGLYRQALSNVRDDQPDFHLDLGDTFWMDNVNNAEETDNEYLNERSYFGLIGDSIPIFLVLGNHENEEGWNADDSLNLPLLSVNARKKFFLNPIPDQFYSGNTDSSLAAINGDHLREDYFAWHWGDALFIAIDPFWYTLTKPYSGSEGGEKNDESPIGNRWDWTLGAQQYQWFRQTLEKSNATYKFVFAHHMTGGTEGYVRGGAKPAPYFEWGGLNADNTWGFDVNRAGWIKPIHQLMVENNVTAFFHGHDHFFAKEELDGIVYQGCPMPSDISYGFGFYNSTNYPNVVRLSNSGHLRVTVSSSQVTVDYVRAYLSGGNNGQVAYTYTMPISTESTPTPSPPPTPPLSPQPAPTNSPSPLPLHTPQPSPTHSPASSPSPSSSPTLSPTNSPEPVQTQEPSYALVIVVVIIIIATIALVIRKRIE